MGAIQMLKCTNHYEDLIAFHFFMFFFFSEMIADQRIEARVL